MPYPDACPECGGTFRNTGTHFTSRRNEVGRHVLLELGCQTTMRRFWWDFTSGSSTENGHTTSRVAVAAAASNGHGGSHADDNGHAAAVATLELPVSLETSPTMLEPELDPNPVAALSQATIELPGTPPAASPSLKEAFARQLQLDRLTLRQMRSWLMSDEARRAIEVAAGATEATYERLSLILFGMDLPQLLGKQAAVPASTGMSAEERLELQREKARIRARLRRAAAKAARLAS
jgi:hypothetical protein